jgi:hypothetical protein
LNYADPDGLNWQVCEIAGKNCVDLDDEQFEQFLEGSPNVYKTPSGDLYVINLDRSETKIGTAAYYDEKKAEALQRAGEAR